MFNKPVTIDFALVLHWRMTTNYDCRGRGLHHCPLTRFDSVQPGPVCRSHIRQRSSVHLSRPQPNPPVSRNHTCNPFHGCLVAASAFVLHALAQDPHYSRMSFPQKRVSDGRYNSFSTCVCFHVHCREYPPSTEYHDDEVAAPALGREPLRVANLDSSPSL